MVMTTAPQTASPEPSQPTWRAPLNRVEYATIRVHDLAETLDWYTDTLDLQVVDKTHEIALLTCGGDNNVDLALRVDAHQGHGVDSYSFGVASGDVLETLAVELTDRGTAVERISVGIPGLDGAIRVQTPSGVPLQVVASGSRATGVQNRGRDNGVAPVDTDHLNLLTTDVEGYARWLTDTFGFATSDAFAGPAGGWFVAWSHITDQHHDLAILATDDPSQTLHHVAFLAADLDHMGEVADRVFSTGARCEWGIGKHGGLGANNFLYLKDPSGNRVEVNSNMNDNPFDHPLEVYPFEAFADFANIWTYSAPPPPGFELGS